MGSSLELEFVRFLESPIAYESGYQLVHHMLLPWKWKLWVRLINHWAFVICFVMIFRYVWLQNPQVTRIDFSEVLPSLILAFMPGAMNFLHFLQKFICISYGILILCFVLSFFTRLACLCANDGFVLAFDMAFWIRISILSSMICRTADFMSIK